MFQTKVVEKIATHFMFSNFFFFLKIVRFMRMWKNIVELGMPQKTIWHMHIA